MKNRRVLEKVKDFYDAYGWQKDNEKGRYLAELGQEDVHESTQRYMNGNELRYTKWFKAEGRYFLDAGCGAKPRAEMSENFQVHVCVDISVQGLKEAKTRLGSRGRYVLADLAHIPFKDGAFASTLASHSVYHIDKDVQRGALAELYRVTQSNRTILVFYTSRYNLVSVLHMPGMVALRFVRLLRGLLRRIKGNSRQRIKTSAHRLYSYAHNPWSLARQFETVDITCLRTLTKRDTELQNRLHLIRLTVPVLMFLERTFPHLMSYVGNYVAIRITRHD